MSVEISSEYINMRKAHFTSILDVMAKMCKANHPMKVDIWMQYKESLKELTAMIMREKMKFNNFKLYVMYDVDERPDDVPEFQVPDDESTNMLLRSYTELDGILNNIEHATWTIQYINTVEAIAMPIIS